MAAKKVYAVRRGKVIGILDSWDACKEAVDGYPGAEYKGFKTLEEARAYMEGIAYTVEPSAQTAFQMEETKPLRTETEDKGRTARGEEAAGGSQTASGYRTSGVGRVSGENEADGKSRAADRDKEAGTGKAVGRKREQLPDREKRPRGMGDPQGGLVAYVDGSYEHSARRYAFGCVFILPDDTVYVENGSGSNPDTAQLRNVSGEMLGAMYAVRWAIKNGFLRIELRYDYEGIEKWVTGAWKSKTELTRKYAAAMRRWMENIQMRFTKVAAHTNVYYNELADRLAKDGLLERDEIPEVWRMEEMEPWAE